MTEEPESLSEVQRANRLSIALEEYKAVRAEISQRLGFQQQVLTFGFGLLGAHLAVFGVLAKEEASGGAITWIAISAASATPVIGLLFCVQDMMIVQLANYEDRELKPELSQLAGVPRLQWNGYRGKERLAESKSLLLSLGPKLTMGFPHALLVAVAVVCIAAAGIGLKSSAKGSKVVVAQSIGHPPTGGTGASIGGSRFRPSQVLISPQTSQVTSPSPSTEQQPHWAIMALPILLLLYYILVRIVVRLLYRRLWNGTLYVAD